MRTKIFGKIAIGAAALAAVFALNCAGSSVIVRPPQDQIDAFLAANPELPGPDRRAINEGRIEIGVRAETVRFLMGEPHSIEQVRQLWAQQEQWRYRRGKTRIFIMESGHVVGIDERAGKR